MIKKVFLSRLSRKIVSQTDPISIDRAHTVGIIAIDAYESQMNELALALEKEGKRPRMVSFVVEPIKTKMYSNQSFNAKDISITGVIQSGELLYFTKQTYDFLICIDPTGDPYIKYLLSKTPARHRIGLYHANFTNQLDMMIMPRKMEEAVDELIQYVKMIKNGQ